MPTLADYVSSHFGIPSPGAVNDKLIAFFKQIYTGSGSPEGVVTASTGSFYFDIVNAVMYAKTSGSGNTGWVSGAGGAFVEIAGSTMTGPLHLYGSAVTSDEAVTKAQLDATSSVFAMAWGVDPRGFAAGTSGAPTANRIYYIRNTGSLVNADKISIYVTTAAGNVQAAVYSNTGTGFTAAPTGSPLGASASVALAGAGARQQISLSSLVTINRGDWVALQFDNAGASIQRAQPGSGMCDGLAWWESPGSFTMANPVGTLASVNIVPIWSAYDA